MDKITQNKKNWYCIKFDVPKDKNITALEFSKKMNLFLEQINEFNHSIVNGIDDTYTVASYVEDFESGSIKWWILDKLNKVDDQAINKFVDSPVKTTIAGILKVSKKKAIECLSDNNFKNIPLEERKMKIINPVVQEIENRKDDLNRNALSPEIKVDETRLLQSLSNMSKISKDLEEQVSFIDDYDNQEEQVTIPNDFDYERDIKNIEIKQLEEEKVLQGVNEIEDIYILLTPTSKKDCMWELEDNGSKIKCQIEDKEFFNKYSSNQVKLGGNEKLKIKMKIETYLEGDKIKKEYTIIKIIERISDIPLFEPDNEKYD